MRDVDLMFRARRQSCWARSWRLTALAPPGAAGQVGKGRQHFIVARLLPRALQHPERSTGGEGQPADDGEDGHRVFLDREAGRFQPLVRAIQRLFSEFTRSCRLPVRRHRSADLACNRTVRFVGSCWCSFVMVSNIQRQRYRRRSSSVQAGNPGLPFTLHHSRRN